MSQLKRNEAITISGIDIMVDGEYRPIRLRVILSTILEELPDISDVETFKLMNAIAYRMGGLEFMSKDYKNDSLEHYEAKQHTKWIKEHSLYEFMRA